MSDGVLAKMAHLPASLQSVQQAYQAQADAPSTLRAYAADLEHYRQWCLMMGYTPLPVTPEQVGLYLTAHATQYALASLRRRVSALARASRLAGFALDTHHPAIRETLRGIGRAHGRPQRQPAALLLPDLRKLLDTCDTSLSGRRDRALLLLGFAAALRRSEIVALDVEHLAYTRTGLQVLLARSKSDAEGKGVVLTIPRGQHRHTDPVHAVEDWTVRGALTDGPLFRRITRWGTIEPFRMHPDGVRQIFARHLAAAGLTGTAWAPLTPHSLRVGFITSAYAAQLSDDDIMPHVRHKSIVTTRRYKRRAQMELVSPAGKVGL